MGRITSIYLSDEEAKQLKRLCEDNQCTQYSALKAAIRELLSMPIEEETTVPEARVTAQQSEVAKETEKTKQSERRNDLLLRLRKALKQHENE